MILVGDRAPPYGSKLHRVCRITKHGICGCNYGRRNCHRSGSRGGRRLVSEQRRRHQPLKLKTQNFCCLKSVYLTMDALQEAQALLERMDSMRAASAGQSRAAFFFPSCASLYGRASKRRCAGEVREHGAHPARRLRPLPHSATDFLCSVVSQCFEQEERALWTSRQMTSSTCDR